MKIIGPDALEFGVDDLSACALFLTDYGLTQLVDQEDRCVFEALDGTQVILRHKSDPGLPKALPTATMLRKTIYGVVDQAAVDAIAAELRKDRPVRDMPDGSIEAVDDTGFALAFRITQRRPLDLPHERVNAPGAPIQRPVNQIGVDVDAVFQPRTLSHIVYFVPDSAACEAFYVKRLGFTVTDRFKGGGPFLRPAASNDHHTLFLIQGTDYMTGLEHFAFHMQGPTELMLAGHRLLAKGYQTFWGPGRHKFGSNWFWYFNSPLGTHVEYDADMDKHDDNWVPRELERGPENAQAFLLESREKWVPGPSKKHD